MHLVDGLHAGILAREIHNGKSVELIAMPGNRAHELNALVNLQLVTRDHATRNTYHRVAERMLESITKPLVGGKLNLTHPAHET